MFAFSELASIWLKLSKCWESCTGEGVSLCRRAKVSS